MPRSRSHSAWRAVVLEREPGAGRRVDQVLERNVGGDVLLARSDER